MQESGEKDCPKVHAHGCVLACMSAVCQEAKNKRAPDSDFTHLFCPLTRASLLSSHMGRFLSGMKCSSVAGIDLGSDAMQICADQSAQQKLQLSWFPLSS